jgi:hypothetical protein
MEEKPKVVYIMGTARSGSTILGVTLDNCEGIFYGGELGGWIERSGRSSYEGSERTGLWNTVLERVNGGAELFDKDVRGALERSSAALRLDRWPARRRLRGRWQRLTESLYRTIAQETGAGHIVDTSSHPLRAHELQRLDGVELHLIYLVRDPHGVVASFTTPGQAKYSDSIFITNAYISLTNLLAAWVFLRQPRARRLFLRHEDFVADPEGVLREILRGIGSDAEIPDLGSLQTGRAFQGNILLRKGQVSLKGRPDEPPRRLLTTLMQLPWPAVHSRLRPRARASGERRS